MSGNDTHADTIRDALRRLWNYAEDLTGVAQTGLASVDALVAERDRERARADQAEAALARLDAAWERAEATGIVFDWDRARGSSAADVDGASYDAGHHESVGERQGRQPAPDPEREARIAACPTPAYHETHRYCPSCPWTERDALSAGSGGREPTL